MKKRLKKILRICSLGLAVLVLGLASVILLVLYDKPLVRQASQKYLARKTGIPVEIGGLDYSLFPLRVTVTSLKTVYDTPIYTVEAVVNRAEARGDLKKILKGEKPALQTVEARLAEVRIRQKKPSPEPIDFPAAVRQLAEILSYADRASLQCDRLEILLPGLDFRLQRFDLALAKGRGQNAFDLRLDIDHLGAATEDGSVAAETRLHGVGTFGLDQSVSAHLRVTLDGPRLTAAGRTESIKNLTLEATGAFKTDEGKISIPDMTIDLPELASINGALTAELHGNSSLEASGRVRIEDLESAAALLVPSRPSIFHGLRLQGKATVNGKYSLQPKSPMRRESLEAAVELENVDLEYDQTGFPLKARLGGTLRVAGPLPELGLNGEFQASLGGISRDKFNIRKTTIRLRALGSRHSLEISGFEGTVEGLAVSLKKQNYLAFDRVKFNGRARLDLDHKSFTLAAFEVQLPDFSPIRFSGRYDLMARSLKEVRCEGRGLRIPVLHERLRSLIPPGLDRWDFDGEAEVVLQAGYTATPERRWDISGEIGLSGAKFNDPCFTLAGDGLRSEVRVRGSYDPSRGAISWTGTLQLDEGESLWKNFYISWKKQPFRASVSGRCVFPVKSFEGLVADFVFPGLGEARAAGSVWLASPQNYDIQAAGRLGIERLFSLYSQADASSGSRPKVGGELTADLNIRGGQGTLSVKGRLSLAGASFESPAAQVSVRGVNAGIPVDLFMSETTVAPSASQIPEKGNFQIEEIRLPSFKIQPPDLTLRCRTNEYSMDAFSLQLFGSRVEFGKTSLSVDPRALSFRGAGSFKLDGLDLSRLPIVPAERPLAGTVKAEFPAVSIVPDKIVSTGQVEADIFGGQIIIRDISVTEPFSRSRAIACDVDLVDLDLKKMTDLIPFGEVTGIIRGKIRDLVISYGQPEQFELVLESVSKKGVPQTFSLKAVNSLTVITSGQTAGGGSASFWMRYLKGFRYEKIGIASTLKNDTFTLDGTIREKGVEYLVKKPPLWGINVINRNPGKKISFKDMMSRLERVGQSGQPKVTR